MIESDSDADTGARALLADVDPGNRLYLIDTRIKALEDAIRELDRERRLTMLEIRGQRRE